MNNIDFTEYDSPVVHDSRKESVSMAVNEIEEQLILAKDFEGLVILKSILHDFDVSAFDSDKKINMCETTGVFLG